MKALSYICGSSGLASLTHFYRLADVVKHLVTQYFVGVFQGYVLSSHLATVSGQSGRVLPKIGQEGQAEALAEFLTVPLSGQTHRAHSPPSAQR